MLGCASSWMTILGDTADLVKISLSFPYLLYCMHMDDVATLKRVCCAEAQHATLQYRHGLLC